MGLCTSIECNCAISSTSLAISGDGSPSDPWVLTTNFDFFAYDTFDDLPDPATVPDLTGFLVREASEIVLVRDGAYALPGTVFVELQGSPSQTSISGEIDVGFTIDAFSPALPLSISGGDLVMHPFFHPAEISIRGIGFVDRSDDIFLDWVEVTAAASAAGNSPFQFISDAELWMDSDTDSPIVPVFGQAKPDPESLGSAPLVVSGSGLSLGFRARSFGGTLNDGLYIWASLTWNSFSLQGQS